MGKEEYYYPEENQLLLSLKKYLYIESEVTEKLFITLHIH